MSDLGWNIIYAVGAWGAATLGVRHRKRIQGKKFDKWDYVTGGISAIFALLLFHWLVR